MNDLHVMINSNIKLTLQVSTALIYISAVLKLSVMRILAKNERCKCFTIITVIFLYFNSF